MTQDNLAEQNRPPFFMVFDVESVGLHGEGFAYGYVVIDANGNEIDQGAARCELSQAKGNDEDREWVKTNVIPHLSLLHPLRFIKHKTPDSMRDQFWSTWQTWKNQGAVLVTDCGWPVEANFLSACIADAPERQWEGPYPLFDLSSILLCSGENPIGTFPRFPDEEPAHNPLNDARQSARVMQTALKRIDARQNRGAK